MMIIIIMHNDPWHPRPPPSKASYLDRLIIVSYGGDALITASLVSSEQGDESVVVAGTWLVGGGNQGTYRPGSARQRDSATRSVAVVVDCAWCLVVRNIRGEWQPRSSCVLEQQNLLFFLIND